MIHRFDLVLCARVLWLTCGLLALSGCGSSALVRVSAQRFSLEYNCPKALVKPLSKHTARVRGCGQVAVYVCAGGECLKESSREAPVAAAEAPAKSLVHGKSSQGNKAIQVDFKRVEGAVRFAAAPVSAPDEVQLVAVMGVACKGCQARLAIDGEPVALVQPAAQMDAGSVAATTTPDILMRIIESHKATFRFGDQDWEVSEEDKVRLKEFLMACKQEQALSGEIVRGDTQAGPSSDL